METDPEPDTRSSYSRLFVVVMALVAVWGVIEVVRSYPDQFFPRHWDEAVYVTDVLAPGALLADHQQTLHYAPAKLGYGIPLSIAVLLYGPDGAMYLSTLLWFLIIMTAGLTVRRWFGVTSAWIVIAFLAFSPFLGKYVAEAGPTLLAAFLFTLLWALYQFRIPWLTGLIVGLIAFVDFKWAMPIGLSIILAELVLGQSRSWGDRLLKIGETGLTALSVLAIVWWAHPPYGEYLKNYIFNHSAIIQLAPSAIFGYYVLTFGAGLGTIVAVVGALVVPLRRHMRESGDGSLQALLSVLILAGVPIVFYSLVSTLKSLRFFAVVFPLFAVLVAVGIGALVAWERSRSPDWGVRFRRITDVALGVIIAGVITYGSDGPARHLRMSAGIHEALRTLSQRGEVGGTVSSYIWPVLQYGWGYPIRVPPFAMWGLLSTDKWILLDDMMDRVTIESRLLLQPVEGMTADSLWSVHEHLRTALEPMFDVDGDFYASDYFLCESTVIGIPTLRRWRGMRPSEGNRFTVYRIDFERLQPRSPDGKSTGDSRGGTHGIRINLKTRK